MKRKGKTSFTLTRAALKKRLCVPTVMQKSARAVWIRLIGKPRGESMSLERVWRDFVGNRSF